MLLKSGFPCAQEHHQHDGAGRPDPEGADPTPRQPIGFALLQGFEDAFGGGRGRSWRSLPGLQCFPHLLAELQVATVEDEYARDRAAAAGRSRCRPECSRAARQDDHAIRQRHCLGKVVGDEQYGLAVALPYAQELGLQQELGLGVEVRCRSGPAARRGDAEPAQHAPASGRRALRRRRVLDDDFVGSSAIRTTARGRRRRRPWDRSGRG